MSLRYSILSYSNHNLNVARDFAVVFHLGHSPGSQIAYMVHRLRIAVKVE